MRKLYLIFLCWWNDVCYKHKVPLSQTTLGNWHREQCTRDWWEKEKQEGLDAIAIHRIKQNKLIAKLGD